MSSETYQDFEGGSLLADQEPSAFLNIVFPGVDFEDELGP